MAVAQSLRAILEGSPVTSDHQVNNAELRRKLEEIEAQAALNGALFFEDAVADLPAGTEGDTAFVLDDGTSSNNGIYLKGASAWAKTADLPAAFTAAATALQPADVGTAAAEDVEFFAAAADGITSAERTKLSGIETGATADQTGAQIKTAYEAEANTNAFTDAEKSKLTGIEASATADQTGAQIKTAYEAEDDTNAFTDAEKAKLTGIETGATADQTGAEIKAAYEAVANTNAFTDAEKTKLTGIETGATADQTGAQIKTAYEAEADTNAFTDAEKTKLTGIEAGADVSPVASVAGRTGTVTLAKADVGLGNVDNTADADKPVSTAVRAELGPDDGFGTLFGRATKVHFAPCDYPLVWTGTNYILDPRSVYLDEAIGTPDAGGDLYDRAVTRHFLPGNIAVIKRGEGDYVLDESAVGLDDAIGTNDGLGNIFDRLPTQHLLPLPVDIISTGDGGHLIPTPAKAPYLGGVVSNEGWLFSENGSFRVTDGAANSGPQILHTSIDGDDLVIVRTRPYENYPTGLETLRLPLNVPWSLGKGINEVWLIAHHGQSQSVANTGEAFSTTAPSADRLAMFAGGIRYQNSDTFDGQDTAVARKDWLVGLDIFEGGLVPLKEGVNYSRFNETPLTSLCSAILPDIPADVGLVGIGLASGGRPVSDLDVGNASWHNLAVTMAYLRALCERKNITFKMGGLFWSQGGQNASDTVAEYQTAVNTGIYDALNQLGIDHGFAAHSIPMFVNGMMHNTTNATMDVARAALAMHDDSTRNITAVGPEYAYKSVTDEGGDDLVHISGPGIIQRSNLEAAAFKRVVIDGAAWNPLRMTSAVLAGTTLTVSTNIAEAQFATPLLVENPDVAVVLGPDLATNGTFDTDTGWTKGAGWTIADGKASHTNVSGALTQPFAADANKTFIITWTIKDYVSGSIYASFLGGTNVNGTTRNANGTYTERLTTVSSVTSLYIGTPNFVGSIDDISVREETLDSGFTLLDDGDGNSPTISSVAVNGSNQIIIQLSAAPTGSNPKLGYALASTADTANQQGPVTGARGEVCDSTTATVTIPTEGSARPLRRVLHTDLIDIT